MERWLKMAKKKVNSKSSAKSEAKRAQRGGARQPSKAPAAGGKRAAVAQPAGTGSRSLDQLRVLIDRVDKRLVKLLNDRARLVEDVGVLKRGTDVPIYAPHREAEVLQRVLDANQGPLLPQTIEAVYRELMSGSFALEQPLRIGYLGPPGSFSHVASTRQFGSSVEYEDLHHISGVFDEVQRGHVDYGLVPIENSTGGGITETLEAFRDGHPDVRVYAEVQIAIHHALLAACEPKQIRRIHSKPEVFAQCRTWLATQYPQAEQVPATSSSAAVRTVAEEAKTAESIGALPGSAAIGSELAGEIYGVHVLFPRIEDNPNNITRFYVISLTDAEASGDDKTSIMFDTEDRPGALVEVLSVFHNAGVNLSHIDKRPSGKMNWEYTFFVDALGHISEPAMAGAIDDASRHCRQMRVLGSFPRSRRIL